MTLKVEKILTDLYEHVLEHPGDLVKPFPEEDPLEVRALDVIAGMTDLYALRLYEEFFSPPDWPLI
jgi:dGTP triphosphohydrolase